MVGRVVRALRDVRFGLALGAAYLLAGAGRHRDAPASGARTVP